MRMKNAHPVAEGTLAAARSASAYAVEGCTERLSRFETSHNLLIYDLIYVALRLRMLAACTSGAAVRRKGGKLGREWDLIHA